MNFTAKKTDLLRALALASGIVERRTTIPILSNVKLEQAGGKLALVATDMDMELSMLIPAEFLVRGDGAQDKNENAGITVPCGTLHDVVKKAAADHISFVEGGERLIVRAGKAEFRLGTLATDDFPSFRPATGAACFTLDALQVCALIDGTKHAVSTEDTRYYLNGIHLHSLAVNGGQRVRAVSTDGHRMALKDEPAELEAELPKVILPRKAAAELRKMLDGVSGPVDISLSDNTAIFALPDTQLATKLIDGVFPEYDRVIPKGNDKILRVTTAVLAKAIERVTTIAQDKTRAVKMTLTKDRILLACTSPDVGSASEDVEAAYTGAPLEIGFNSAYLLSVLALLPDQAQIELADPASPAILRAVVDSTAATDSLHIVMPMRV